MNFSLLSLFGDSYTFSTGSGETTLGGGERSKTTSATLISSIVTSFSFDTLAEKD